VIFVADDVKTGCGCVAAMLGFTPTLDARHWLSFRVPHKYCFAFLYYHLAGYTDFKYAALHYAARIADDSRHTKNARMSLDALTRTGYHANYSARRCFASDAISRPLI
jgi:hypothetical protein